MDPVIGNIISDVLQAVLAVILPFLVIYATKWFQAHTASLISKIPKEYLALAKSLADTAVSAAEVAGANGYIESKENYAIDALQKLLADHGIGAINVGSLESLVKEAFLQTISSSNSLPAVRPPGTGTASAPPAQ